MKKILLFFAVTVIVAACNNNADNQDMGKDSTDSVVLPGGRSSDSLAVPPQTSDSARMADSARAKDNTRARKDSTK
ncbi:MAG: hypothetical protein ACTHMV_17315 [Chitinophagaceae bacterium]